MGIKFERHNIINIWCDMKKRRASRAPIRRAQSDWNPSANRLDDYGRTPNFLDSSSMSEEEQLADCPGSDYTGRVSTKGQSIHTRSAVKNLDFI